MALFIVIDYSLPLKQLHLLSLSITFQITAIPLFHEIFLNLCARYRARAGIKLLKMKTSMYVEQIIILNHCDWIRIEENIDTPPPPPKTPLLGGGLGTVDELIFGYVPRRVPLKYISL